MPFMAFAQTAITGTVLQKDGTPILGANVYLDGTYDGTSSNMDCVFRFTTEETGIQTLKVTFISFEAFVPNVYVS